MATLLTRSWTAADTTSWEDVGFRRILGAALLAVVEANAGHCGAVAGERVFFIEGFPQTPGHKIALDLTYADASGAGRAPGVGARWSDDGRDGYMAQLDSNLGAARARIRRRRNGAWTDLTGWVDVSALVLPAALEAGATVQLRTANEDGQVALALRVNGTLVLEHDDTDDDRLEASGGCALLIDGASSLDDVVYDSLTVTDLADEFAGDPADLDVETSLVVDGTAYSWAQLEAAGITVGVARQSYDQGDAWEVSTTRKMDEADPILYVGAIVKVALKGVVVASGRLHPAERKLVPGEGQSFKLVDARELAADVELRHPVTHTDHFVWNLPKDHADYDAAYDNKTVGQAIKTILDSCVDGSTGLRAHLAAPPDEGTPPYVQAELDLITVKLVGMSGGGDPVTAVEQLLSITKYLLRIDPDTKVWHFVDRTAGTIRQVNVSDRWVLGDYTIDPKRNRTAVLARGSRPEKTATTLSTDIAGGLEPQWPSSLESTLDDEKSLKNRDDGLVDSISGTVDAPTMTPDTVGPPAFSMAALEWVLCALRFKTGPEAGEVYRVSTNSALAFTFGEAWRNGGPDPGDEFEVYGDALGGGRDNAYTEIGRRFKLSDTSKGIAKDACLHVKLTQENIQKITGAKVVTPADPAEPVEILTDMPAIGLVNFTGPKPDPCVPEGAVEMARVEAELPLIEREDPRVPRRWFPRDGSGNDAYRGTSYTTDPDKWDGGGMPGRGDPGVMKYFEMNVPEFDGSAGQAADIDAASAELLSFLSPLARSVKITIGGELDMQWAGLGSRLQLIGGPPELATVEDLTVLAVEWDASGGGKTTIYAGNQAAGHYDIQGMREEIVERFVRRRLKRDQATMQELLNCLQGNQHGAGMARDLAPRQICGDRVASGVTRAGRSVKEDVISLLKISKATSKIIEAQKGGTFEPHDPDSDEPLTYTRHDGQKFYVTPEGTWRSAGDDNVVGNGDDEDVDSPWNHPDDLAPGSIEGLLWAAIQALAGNLGKTLDMDTMSVVPPGSVAGPDDNWVTFGTGGTRTPVPNGGTVPTTNETPKGPVLANLLKTEKPDGGVEEPGGTLPGGGKFHGPGGALPIPNGGFAPGSSLSLLFADFKTKGFSVGDLGDPGGLTFMHPDGRQYRVTPVPYATTPKIEQVVAASGGVGTGDNAGDYETPATPYVAAPAESVQATSVEGDGVDLEEPDEGGGVYLPANADHSALVGPVALPASTRGYSEGSAVLSVVFRGDDAGDGSGNYRVNVYATWRPAGGLPESEMTLGSTTIANLPDPRATTAVTYEVPAPTDPTPGRGTVLDIRVEREGTHGADTATDRLAVIAAHVDVPVKAATVGVKGYS